MHGGVPNKEFNENNNQCISDSDKELSYILNELERNRAPLDDPDNIKYIISLLKKRANPKIQGKDGKTLSYYLDEKLSNILNELESNRGLLDNPDRTQYIMLLLGTGANPNVQNQAGKTLLHYVAERNDTDGIVFLLKAGADPNMQDQSGKTPSEYATEDECRQAIKGLGCSSNDKTTCTKSSDSDSDNDSDYYSDENEGNLATPDSSVDDCSNNSDNGTRVKSVKSSNCNTEEDLGYGSKDEDSSCSSSDYLFLEDSLLAKLEIPLTTSEEGLIDKFCEKIRGITAQNKQESEESILKSIEKIVNEYLEKGIRLNSNCSNGNEKGDKETVTNLIFEEIEDILRYRVKPRDETREYRGGVNDITDQDDEDKDKALDIIESITSNLLLKGGKARQKFFFGNTELAQNYRSDYISNLGEKCEEIESKLIGIAHEGIVNKNEQAQKGETEEEDIDNIYFYIKYPQDSIIEPVKIFNKAEALKDEELNLKVGILQIGKSIVRVESVGKKRNYTDTLKGSIEMSFTTEVGEISIYLSPSKEGGNKIKVEIDEENKAKFNKLKDKSSLGKDCLLEGENVSEVIGKNFESVSTESIEITKDVPSTDLTQVHPQREARSRG